MKFNNHRIKIDLFSQKSVNEAANMIDQYTVDFMPRLLGVLDRLAEEGIQVIDRTVSGVQIDGHAADAETRVEIVQLSENSAMAIIILEGTEVLFVEFGAGIRFSNPQNPKAGEMGMGVGTYPGQTNAFDPKGWWYSDGNGSHHSYGNPAAMPMYKAIEELKDCQKVARIIEEFFG